MATSAPDSILIQSLADSHAGIGQNIEGSGAAAGNPSAGAQSVNGQYVSSGAISGGGLGSGTEVSVTPGEGNVGSFSIAANGSYTLSVSDTAAQQFAPGEAHTETFVLQSADGSTHQLSFTVQQTPEGVSIGAPAVAVPDPVTGMFTDTQTATGSFPVNAEGQVPSVQSLLGAGEPSLGMLSISDSGQYTYSVSTSASQAINANDTRAESFSVQTPDGGNQQISFTVHGAGQDGGITQQPISVNVSGNDAGDGRVLPDDAALTALDASAVGFWRVPTDGPGVAAANTAIASARGATTTGIPTASSGADAARSAAVAGLSDAGDSGPPISRASVLQDDGAGLDVDAEVSEPGLASPPIAPLALSSPIVEAAPVPAPAVVPDPPPEPTAEPAPALTPEPAPAPVVAVAPEPAVPPGPPEPPGPPVVVPVPSVIGAVFGASVQEDVNVQPGNLLARTGLIEVTASTPALATFSTSVVSTGGNLGTLSIDSLGSYSYNVSNAIVQYLGVADSKVDSFTIATVDGTTKEVQFTILGTNDAATIGDLPFAAVTEDLGVIANQLRASGTLSVLDLDQNQSVFQTAVTGAVNNLGTLVLAANGSYTYSVANTVVQYLGGTDSKIETFTVKSFDGTEKIEQVTIFGVNDAAVIGDLPVATVTEDLAVVADQLFARGTISITDVDQNQASFQTVVDSALGNLGALTLATDGQYTYSVANAAVQYLGALDTKLETFTVTSFDGTTKIEQVTIRGVNDAALITGPATNTVTEDVAVVGGKLTASGSMLVTDVDQNQSSFQTIVVPVGSTLGSLALGADGLYSFTVLNADAQYLGAADSKVDTFTVKSFDGTAKDVSFTTFGTNDAALIGDPTDADVTESFQVVSGNLQASGTISVSDVDQNQSGFQTGVTSASGALGNLVLSVNGSYVYSVANAAVLYLSDAETKVDTFTIKSIDGTTKDVSFTIYGVNQGATIGDPSPAAVVEDLNPILGRLTETGRISITDPDTGEAKFQTAVTAAAGDKGQLVLAEDGTYTYSVANADVQYLGAGIVKTDTFTIKSFDGTSKAVSFTITGVNDDAVIGDPNPASVTEDLSVVANRMSASGQLTVTDVDTGESTFRTGVTAAAGDKGQLTLATDGRYTYSVLNADVQYLGAGITKIETFTVKSFDGTAKDISFTIIGVNDAAVMGGPVPGAVTEDLNLNGLGRLTEIGRLTVSDADTGESSFQTGVTAGAGDLGQLTLATDGSYTYGVANADVQYLGAGITKTDTFTVKSFDGTEKEITFTITGVNDDAVIGGPSPAAVTEDLSVNGAGRLVESGRLTVSDVDTGEASFSTVVTAAAGDKGQLTLATDGSYTYSVLNTEVQYLGAGETKTDTFTVKSLDGTAKDISFTITGVNDVAVIGDLSNNRVTEDLAPVGPNLQAAGIISVSDADQNQGFFSTTVAPTSGNIGTLVLDRNGNYVYRAPNQDTQYLRATDSKVDTFRIAALDGTSKDVSFRIQGVNDAAIIGAPTASVVRENEDVSPDGFLSAAGTISISDADQFESAFLTTVVPSAGTDGTLTLAADGSYTYKVDNSLHLYLPLNQVKTETFTISSVDGTTKNIDFTIRGVNNPAQIGAPSPAAVTEDVAVGLDGKLTETGRITISDLDNGEAAFRTVVEAGAGDKGQLTLAADGAYSYSVANSAVQYLGAGQTQVDTFVIKTIDGTAKTLSFTITGVNDVATISTPTPARVTEDIGAADGYLRTGGILTVTDADAGQSSFQNAVTALGSHIGALALASDGTYQYSVANAQVQYLGDGETKVESFTIKSLDGTSKDVSFTIIGVNDGAIIGDPTDSIVIEDTDLFRGNLVASGTISITDPDAGQSSFKTTVVPLVNTWGSLTLATDGAYTYSVATNIIALQALNEGQTKVDQFTITSFDGTKKVVDFNIKGLFDGASTNVTPVVGPLIQQSFFVGDAQKNIAVGGPDETLAKDSQDGVNLNRGSATYWVDGKPVSQLPSWIKFAGFEQVINVDPSYINADLFNLATGATKVVDINYVISDNNGGKVAQSAMITVTGKDIYTPVFSSTSGLTDLYSAGTNTKSIDLLEGVVKSPGGVSMSIKNVVISLDGVEVQSLPGVSGLIGGSTTAFSIDTSASAYTSMATGQSKTAVISYDVVNTVTGNADLFKSMVQTEIITIVKGAAVAPSIITGTSRSDVLRAGDSGQTLIGVGGNDTLIGGKGNDTLISGGGGDVLTGGGGANTFKYVSLADSPKSAATATDTITDFSKSQGDKVDLSGILTSSSTVTSTINIDQTLSPSSTTMTLTVGGDTYQVATLAGQELSTPDILANSASGTNLTTALNGASWTTVVDVSGSNGAPISVTASGPTASVSGASANPTGNWTEVVTSGAAVVDTTAQQTTFTTAAASNAVTITTADTAVHTVANVSVVQWHL
jgi:VCBS repeat-containing protein